MTQTTPLFHEARRFRLLTVRGTLLSLMIAAAIAFRFNPDLAHGILLGGIAGLLGFWVMAKKLEKVASIAPEKLQFAVFQWAMFRLGLYAIAFTRAVTLDREEFRGLIGAVIGFLIVRAVITVLGITGADQIINEPKEDPSASEHDG